MTTSGSGALVVAVPAHLNSSRLPRKVLATIGGEPMLKLVLDRCREARGACAVVLCTDAPELAAMAHTWGHCAVLRDERCLSGTERIARALPSLREQHCKNVHLEDLFVINVQADQPFIDPGLIERLHSKCLQLSPEFSVATPIYQLAPEQIHNPAIVKVLTTANRQRAITFSRAALPYIRDIDPRHWHRHTSYWGHIGVYAMRGSILSRWQTMPVSPLETLEGLEQLRLIEAGVPIAILEEKRTCLSVDTPAQLEQARRYALSH